MTTAAQHNARHHRGTIFVEDGELMQVDEFPGDQYIMRIRAPRCAAAARPGSFVHVHCDETLPMRRPLSIMRAADDWIELLYKVAGKGLYLLARKKPGDIVNIIGPIGRSFSPSPGLPNCLLLGGGVGIPPIIFLADALRADKRKWNPLAILGSEIPFPFSLHKSSLPTPWLDTSITSAMPLLESWGIPSRLTSLAGFTGCLRGYVSDLAEIWLQSLRDDELARTEVFACGPPPMLKAAAELATRYSLPCQVSLEEFMACGVGGCAGCTVLIESAAGPAMQRVCVDGPVFDAASVVWQT